MKKMYLNRVLLFSAIAILGTGITGCSDDDDDNSTPQLTQEQQIEQMIQEVRNTTVAYHEFDNATAAGWEVAMSPCVAHPDLGGMGFHYGRMEYMDGRVNHLEPQVLLYEPKENGGFTFVGVEYIVPFEILPAESTPPSLFYHSFHANPDLEIWALHVWTERSNPSGMFSDFNPEVSCD